MRILFEILKAIKIPMVLMALVGFVYTMIPKDKENQDLTEDKIEEIIEGKRKGKKGKRSIASSEFEKGQTRYIKEKVFSSEQYISRSQKEKARSVGSSSSSASDIQDLKETQQGYGYAGGGEAFNGSGSDSSSPNTYNPAPSYNPSPTSNNDTGGEAEVVDNSSKTSDNNTSESGGDSNSETPIVSGSGPTIPTDSNDNDDSTPSKTTTSSPTPKTLSCTFDKSEGTYSSNIDVVLSCSETADIHFCVQTGGTCCDPTTNPTAFTDKVSLSGDGDYCVSFIGSVDTLDSSLVEAKYKIDTTIPSLNVSASRKYIQTTEISSELQATSSDFGKNDYFYHQFNLYSHNPTSAGLDWNCKEIYNNYVSLTGPNPFITNIDFSVSGLLPTDQINYVMKLDKLAYGVNHIATIVEDRERSVMGCQTTPITLEDFGAYGFLGTAEQAETPGVGRSIASFTSFGHFEEEAPALPTKKGEQESTRSDMKLESNFIKITH